MKKPSTLDVLLLAQRELREYWAKDKDSQALIEIKQKIAEIKENELSEKVIGFLNIVPNDIPKSLYKKLQDYDLYTYMDTHDLLEHLYNVDGVMEQARELDVKITKEETKALGKIQAMMNDENCGYFRIIKF